MIQELLDYDTFVSGLQELQTHYNRKLTDFALSSWYKYLKCRMTDEKFVAGIEECICTCEFMPTPQKFADMAGAITSAPGENWMMYKQSGQDYFALPSTEILVESLTDEERHLNLVKLCEKLSKQKTLKKKFNFEKPAKEKFEDMRQLLLSGRSGLVKEALMWARRQPNVLCVYGDDGDDLPVDFKWIDDVSTAPEEFEFPSSIN